jgi:hypothetical protein
MNKNKKRFTLSATIIAIAAWLLTSVALYWLFIQIYHPLSPLPVGPSEELPKTIIPPNEIRLQLPTETSPKLEPDLESGKKEFTIKSPPIESDNEENSEEEKDLPNDSKSNIMVESEKSSENSNQLPNTPNNSFKPKPETVSTPVEPAKFENPYSWVSVSEKIMIIENNNSQLIDIINSELSADDFNSENQDDDLANKKWSTVGEQLIKVEEQMDKSVKEL